MGAKEEATVNAFCDAWGDGKTQFPDTKKILSLMSENAIWHLSVPNGPVIKGRTALEAEIARQVQFTTYMRCTTLKIASSENLVFTERLDNFQFKGKRVNHALIAVFEIDPDGRISAWREYFDTADLAAQMGLTTEDVTSAMRQA